MSEVTTQPCRQTASWDRGNTTTVDSTIMKGSGITWVHLIERVMVHDCTAMQTQSLDAWHTETFLNTFVRAGTLPVNKRSSARHCFAACLDSWNPFFRASMAKAMGLLADAALLALSCPVKAAPANSCLSGQIRRIL